MRAWGFLKNRAMVASLGAVLIFGGSAVFAVSQLTHHAAPAGQANTASAATSATTTSAAATATAGAGSGADATATTAPTAASIPPTPTSRPPQPTPTIPVGKQGQIQGTVTSISSSANSFTVKLAGSGVIYTIVVNGSTQYSGQTASGQPVKSLSDIAQDMNANVAGVDCGGAGGGR